MKTIVLITGMTGAGKTSTGTALSKELNFSFFSIGQFQRDFARKQGFEDVTEFNRKMGLQKAYYQLVPEMLEAIQKMAEKSKGIVVKNKGSVSDAVRFMKRHINR